MVSHTHQKPFKKPYLTIVSNFLREKYSNQKSSDREQTSRANQSTGAKGIISAKTINFIGFIALSGVESSRASVYDTFNVGVQAHT